ncbi:MAG: PKD domain-containing protein [Bacteroidetes bacterium]|nr:PKD domain-containing protein [Bacteroidota bacterium]
MIFSNNKKLCWLFLFALAVIGSCKKDYPAQPNNPTPEFSFSGTIGGSSTNIQAGVNNYYMSTSYTLDANGVYDFTGEFRDKNCSSNCANSLKIYLKDYRQYSVQPTVTDSSITTGYYSFATPVGASSKYDVVFGSNLQNGTGQTWNWDFGDGTTFVQTGPTALHQYLHPGVYNVSLNIQSTSSCSSSLANNIVMGQAGGHVQLSFASTPNGNTVSLASTTGGGIPPYTYDWDFGDSNSATTTAPTYTYTYGASGVYPITLTRTDAVNTVEVCHRNFATQTATTCYAFFSVSSATPVSNAMNLSDVMLEWRDASGTLWTSANNSQPGKSMFKVISVENYQNNLSGQPTKKVHAKISCTLYNGTNSIVLDGDAVFSVAHL